MSKGVAPSPSDGPKEGRDEAVAPLSATAYVPPVLANPLSVRAAVLRKPELAQVSLPEMVEEGDILFDVLANPLYHPLVTVRHADDSLTSQRRSEAARLDVQGVDSVLSLPSVVGKHFVGQPFRAILSFHNAATYPLTTVVIRINIVTPSVKHVALVSHECPAMEAKGNLSFTVEYLLKAPGQYTVSVVATCIDIAKEVKRLTWASTIDVKRAVVEVQRSLRLLPISFERGTGSGKQADPGASGVPSTPLFPLRKYSLTVCLQNASTIPVVVENVELRVKDNFQVLLSSSGLGRGGGIARLREWSHFADVTTRDNPSDTVAPRLSSEIEIVDDLFLRPNDKRSYFFEFAMKPEALRSFLIAQRPFGDQSTLAPKTVDVGHVVWNWRRPNGDSGEDGSEIVQLALFKCSMIELFVTDVEPKRPEAGRPVRFECMIVNHDAQESGDLSLRIRPELLAPSFVYTGPLVVPIGVVASQRNATLMLTLVPWQAGWLSLRGGLEVCAGHGAERVVWPLAPRGVLGKGDELREPYPPVICELLVC